MREEEHVQMLQQHPTTGVLLKLFLEKFRQEIADMNL